jgi:sulfhydrogenase subunit beta (sulfur reductase)
VRELALSVAIKDQWLLKLSGFFAVFAPRVAEGRVHWQRTGAAESGGSDTLTPALRRIRAAEPVKSFVFAPRRAVGALPVEPVQPDSGRQVLFGAKSCDVAALVVHDRVLGEGEYADPFFVERRRNTFVVVADCPQPETSCFCNLLGLRPFAEDADIVLSVVGEHYVLRVSERGEELVGVAPELFSEVGAGDPRLALREGAREAAVAALSAMNPKPFRPDMDTAVAARLGDPAFWARHAETCVECFGCLMGCPTCYCFLLYDQARDKGLDRTRVWDACYEAAYARVGGGGNPRAEFVRRFANRFACKFVDAKRDRGSYACTGCGRCFAACMGRIDIRKVLAEV